MEQLSVEWTGFSKSHGLECEKPWLVDSNTPKEKRASIRDLLEKQNFQYDRPNILVIATVVFAKSITLNINGLIDTNMVMTVDRNGFLNLHSCTAAQTIQRKGRGGRVGHETMYMQLLRAQHITPQDETSLYVMPKRPAISLILMQVRLRENFPIIGVPENLRKNVIFPTYKNLESSATKSLVPLRSASRPLGRKSFNSQWTSTLELLPWSVRTWVSPGMVVLL